MANPNITNTTSILGVTNVVSSASTSSSTIISSVTSNHVYKLNSVIAANKTTAAAAITLVLTRSAVNYNLAYQLSVPANASIILVGKDSPLYLQESDALAATAGTASAIDIIASFEDIS